MGEFIKRRMFGDSWDIDVNVSWFSDMAAQGLHLHHISNSNFYFEEGAPQRKEYCIVVLNENECMEQIMNFEESGWDFVVKHKIFYVFASPKERRARELYTDLGLQSDALTKLVKKTRRNTILIFLGLPLLICLLGLLFKNNHYFFKINSTSNFQQIAMLLIFICAIYEMVKEFRAVAKLRRVLQEGDTINHNADWKRSRFFSRASCWLSILIPIFIAVIGIVNTIDIKDVSFSEAPPGVPILQFADIEGDFTLEEINDNGVEWYGTFFAPVQYTAFEYSSEPDSESLQTEFYELRFSKMAEGLLFDLMDLNIYGEDNVMEKIQDSPFDTLYIVEREANCKIFGIWGNTVIFVSYYGEQKTDLLLTRLAEKMEKQYGK